MDVSSTIIKILQEWFLDLPLTMRIVIAYFLATGRRKSTPLDEYSPILRRAMSLPVLALGSMTTHRTVLPSEPTYLQDCSQRYLDFPKSEIKVSRPVTLARCKSKYSAVEEWTRNTPPSMNYVLMISWILFERRIILASVVFPLNLEGEEPKKERLLH